MTSYLRKTKIQTGGSDYKVGKCKDHIKNNLDEVRIRSIILMLLFSIDKLGKINKNPIQLQPAAKTKAKKETSMKKKQSQQDGHFKIKKKIREYLNLTSRQISEKLNILLHKLKVPINSYLNLISEKRGNRKVLILCTTQKNWELTDKLEVKKVRPQTVHFKPCHQLPSLSEIEMCLS